MKPEKAAFLAAIKDNYSDDTTRLIFADWLEENGCDDEANEQRYLAESIKKAREYIEDCAGECEISYDRLIDGAERYLERGDWLCIGTDTPECMWNTEKF